MALRIINDGETRASVRAQRRQAYPAIGDQLDAIWKQINQDRLGGKDLVAEADAVLNKVLAVKAALPLSGGAKQVSS